MAEPDFTSILNAFSSPILIAKPVREGSEIKDFELVFTNKAFLVFFQGIFNFLLY